jgi:hypothetical protein
MTGARDEPGWQEPRDDASVLDGQAERAIPLGVAGAAPFPCSRNDERVARRAADARLGRAARVGGRRRRAPASWQSDSPAKFGSSACSCAWWRASVRTTELRRRSDRCATSSVAPARHSYVPWPLGLRLGLRGIRWREPLTEGRRPCEKIGHLQQLVEMARPGVEPGTPRFSGSRSTTGLPAEVLQSGISPPRNRGAIPSLSFSSAAGWDSAEGSKSR